MLYSLAGKVSIYVGYNFVSYFRAPYSACVWHTVGTATVGTATVGTVTWAVASRT